jgi:hypothetical protein
MTFWISPGRLGGGQNLNSTASGEFAKRGLQRITGKESLAKYIKE